MPTAFRAALLSLVCALTWAGAAAAIPTRNLELEAHFNDYPPASTWGYASCWSYVHGDGREYAVIGTSNGTAIYNVTDPEASYFIGFVAGPTSLWREMKSYRSWIYVVTEGVGGAGQPAPGVQIIRMTDPEHPVLAATYATNFQTSHTVSVDTARAVLICNGTRFWSGSSGTARGVRLLSLADPEAPVEIGWWPGGALPVSVANYVHDSVPMGDRLYASSVYAGTQRVLDFTDPAAPFEISSWTYPGGYYTHNAWPDATQSHLYVTDEQNGQTLRVFDISNVSSPTLVNEYSPNRQAIVHNAHVLGDELWLANYTEGVRVLDISDPAHPAEFGWADTYDGPSGNYNGVWGVTPYFPSGTVIASDMNTGLYVFRPIRNYGLVRVELTASGPGAASSCGPGGACCCAPGPCSCIPLHHAGVAGAKITVETTGDSAIAGSDGIVQLAVAPGTHTVRVRQFGYFDATAVVDVAQGERDTIPLALTARASGPFSGTVTNAATLGPLEQAEVILAATPLHDHTDAAGIYDFAEVPEDVYLIELRRPGFVPRTFMRAIHPGDPGQDFSLHPAPYWNPIEASTGWSVGGAGDNAITGMWTWGDPLGTSVSPPSAPSGANARRGRGPGIDAAAGPAAVARVESLRPGPAPGPSLEHEGHTEEGATPPGPVQPGDDRTPAPGTFCFFTGQGTDSTFVTQADVDAGKTSLTSPLLDLSALADPVIGYWQWFYSEFGAPDDWLAVLISNDAGATWTPVDTTRGTRGHWVERTIRVADHLPPTAQVRLRFVAADFGVESVVEAAVDDLTLYDGLPEVVATPFASVPRLAFRRPAPNPSTGEVALALELPRSGALEVEVLDVTGRRVRTLHRGPASAGFLHLRWDGASERGESMPAGRYYVRASAGGERTTTRLVRIR